MVKAKLNMKGVSVPWFHIVKSQPGRKIRLKLANVGELDRQTIGEQGVKD